MYGQKWEADQFHNEESGQESAGSLYEALQEYADTDFYPCHMPGHKRNPQAGEMAEYYRFDITEIDGFDDLHHAGGLIREAQERARHLYGAEETHYLVNGSTCGVLASILAVTGRGDEILIARNCHKSVYHAAMMQGLVLHYYCPQVMKEFDIYDGVDVQEINRLLDRYPNSKAVVITSPTYEGILSDVKAIAQAVHDRGKILIVDEAHGAHLKEGAVAGGADLVIHSLHKTLPAMTQTALLHISGNRVDRRKLRKYLTMLQTSSPSYVMMASMDCCIRYMEEHGQELFSFYQEQYEAFLQKVCICRHIRIGKLADVTGKRQLADAGSSAKYALAGWDTGKLVISVKGTSLSGQQLYDILRDEYHLQMEMAAATYVLAIMTVMDTEEGWQRLADAIVQIDDRIEEEAGERRPGSPEDADEFLLQSISERSGPVMRMIPSEAFHRPEEEIPLAESVGHTLSDFICLYPPGIPLLVPGEVMSRELLEEIQSSIRMGLKVQGVTDAGKIPVVVEGAYCPKRDNLSK